LGWKNKRRTGNIFLNIRPEMQQKMKQPSAYPLGGHADGCVFHQSYHSIFGGSSSVSFLRLQSDFPYTIFTPFQRGVVWNCMKLYSDCLCGKHAEIKNYRHLWDDIEI
jgi:hypothetical protein